MAGIKVSRIIHEVKNQDVRHKIINALIDNPMSFDYKIENKKLEIFINKKKVFEKEFTW